MKTAPRAATAMTTPVAGPRAERMPADRPPVAVAWLLMTALTTWNHAGRCPAHGPLEGASPRSPPIAARRRPTRAQLEASFAQTKTPTNPAAQTRGA
jgi:hypothetical protein